VVFFLLLYYGVGFSSESSRAVYFFLMFFIAEVYSVTLGQALAALSPTIVVAALYNPFLLMLFSMFCGVSAPPATLPRFWRVWMYPLDPFTRLISGLVGTGLHGVPVLCTPDEYSVFRTSLLEYVAVDSQLAPPSGQTCDQYAGAFATAVGGYLNNGTSTTECEFCPYVLSQNYFEALEISYDTRWRDLGIFVRLHSCYSMGLISRSALCCSISSSSSPRQGS
jgi:ATP-binding cassette subfamily G (WHITE) protein 2 (SNQ2)